MTGTLALIGGAEWTDGCTFDRTLVADQGAERVVVVPTAAAYEAPDSVINRATAWFEQLGVTVDVAPIYRRDDANDPAMNELLGRSPFTYVCGGSPMHLRSVLLGTTAWAAIERAWRHGGVLAAAAEGATALSSHMVDPRGGAFTSGLGLLDSVTVIPSYNRWSEDKWHRTVRLAARGVYVLGVDEATAVILADGEWRVEGVGSVVAYVDGERIDLADVPTELG